MRSEATAIRLTGWNVVRGIRWRPLFGAGVTVLVTAVLLQPPVQTAAAVPTKADPVLYAQAQAHPSKSFSVIVREGRPGTGTAEDLVRTLGGRVLRELGIVGGFAARVPGSAVSTLTSSPAVWRVWGDASIRMAAVNMANYDRVAPNTTWREAINLPQASRRYNGAGVGVALLDTGVVPVPDLVKHVSHVVDLSAEHDGLDRYGHGTHMAGIIVGDGTSSGGTYKGVAPGASLISIKVAGVDGSTDVSEVIAGLQWAVAHRTQYDIRVLNLSFGTDSRQPYSIDPLDYALEQTWRSGIFVAVAAGNRGPGAGTVTKPGDDPYVVTVGAEDTLQTPNVSDDQVASFSSLGPTQDGFAKPDLVAPGISIVSVRDPGSLIDVTHASARVGDAYFKGTGTSQATAVVSGVAALMFQAKPSLTPAQAKWALLKTANRISTTVGAGAGVVNANGAVNAALSSGLGVADTGLTPSTGLGSLDASRGSDHVYVWPAGSPNPVLLTGEYDALGNSWSGKSWSGNAWSGNAWSDVAWEGNAWSGSAWSGTAWSGKSWSGTSWSGKSWSGNAWSGKSWSGDAWSGNAWSGNAWSGNAWSGNAWSGNAWS
jgi:serine protease AprX